MTALLEMNNLTKKYYEGSAESRAVDHVSLTVDKGEFVMIMGASGSGKTSLLHLIAGIDTFDDGTVRYTHTRSGQTMELAHMSETAKAMFRRTDIGIVFQQQCLIPDLTVYENIMLPLMLAGGRKKSASRRETIFNLCDQFGLMDHIRKYPSQLSGGQQQRVAILRAVVNRPPLLLCDEPTGSLNSAQSRLVMELLLELNQKGQTILVVTHDVHVAARGSRIVYVEDGHVAGELKFFEEHSPDAHKEAELMDFLQQRGW